MARSSGGDEYLREKLLQETLASIQLDPTITGNLTNAREVLRKLLESVEGRMELFQTAEGVAAERARRDVDSRSIEQLKQEYANYLKGKLTRGGPLLVGNILEKRDEQFQRYVRLIADQFFSPDERVILQQILDTPYERLTFGVVEGHQLKQSTLYGDGQLAGVEGQDAEGLAILQFYDFIRTLEDLHHEIHNVRKHVMVRNRVPAEKRASLMKLMPAGNDVPWEFTGADDGFHGRKQLMDKHPYIFSLSSTEIYDPQYHILVGTEPMNAPARGANALALAQALIGSYQLDDGFRSKTPFELSCDEILALRYTLVNHSVALGQGLFKVYYTHGLARKLHKGNMPLPAVVYRNRPKIDEGKWINTFEPEPVPHAGSRPYIPLYNTEECLHSRDTSIVKMGLNHWGGLATDFNSNKVQEFDTTLSVRNVAVQGPVADGLLNGQTDHEFTGAIGKYWNSGFDGAAVAGVITAGLVPDVARLNSLRDAASLVPNARRRISAAQIDFLQIEAAMKDQRAHGNPIWACPRLRGAYNRSGVPGIIASALVTEAQKLLHEALITANYARRVLSFWDNSNQAAEIKLHGFKACSQGKIPVFYGLSGAIMPWSEALLRGPDGNLYLNPSVDTKRTQCADPQLAPYVPGITNKEQFAALMANAGRPAFSVSDAELNKLMTDEQTAAHLLMQPSQKDNLKNVFRELLQELKPGVQRPYSSTGGYGVGSSWPATTGFLPGSHQR
jgi:hypothetical protein